MVSAFILIRDFWPEKGAVWRLFKNDMLAKTRTSRSSAVWNVVMPIVPLGFYIILSSMNVFPDVDTMNRLTFVSIGVTLWLLFAGLISVPMNTLESTLKALETDRLSILSQLIIRLSGLFFDSFLRVIAVLVILVLFSPDQITPNPVFIPFVFLASLCCFGVGVFLGALNLAFGNISKLVSIVLQYGIFVSGVIFPVARLGKFGEYIAYNPLFMAIDSVRSFIVLGVYQPTVIFWSAIALGLCLFLWSSSILCILKSELRGRL